MYFTPKKESRVPSNESRKKTYLPKKKHMAQKRIIQKELAPKDLIHSCDEKQFRFRTTEELEPLTEIVGQERYGSA